MIGCAAPSPFCNNSVVKGYVMNTFPRNSKRALWTKNVRNMLGEWREKLDACEKFLSLRDEAIFITYKFIIKKINI